jgi:hypothetical protein
MMRRLWLRLRRWSSDRRSRRLVRIGSVRSGAGVQLTQPLLLQLLLREAFGLFLEPLSLLALIPPV